ncbi:MAG: ABC transporter permease [Erysipelotrichaceae bacterium]
MSSEIIISAIVLGLIFAIMSLGIYISFRILNIPDLTIDGSFTLGCAVSAIFALNGQPELGILLAILAGIIAGCVTGFLQTKLKVQTILAGILTMTGLYSINLRIMKDAPNISLFGKDTIFSRFEGILKDYTHVVVLMGIVIVIIVILYWFLRTQLGMALRATGDNEDMVRASSLNTDAIKIMGLAIANSLVALAGALFAQQQNFADVSSGIGMMVIGLASVIVGEAIFVELLKKHNSLILRFSSVVIGAILYRFILTLALQIGMPASDLKLFSAILVTIAISLPVISKYIKKRRNKYVKVR